MLILRIEVEGRPGALLESAASEIVKNGEVGGRQKPEFVELCVKRQGEGMMT